MSVCPGVQFADDGEIVPDHQVIYLLHGAGGGILDGQDVELRLYETKGDFITGKSYETGNSYVVGSFKYTF